MLWILALGCRAEPEVDSDPCLAVTLFADRDGDGFGDAWTWIESCEAVAGYVEDATDCNDVEGRVSPGADEVCDDRDDDCDGVVDEGAVDAPVWYADADGDGFGDAESPLGACEAEEGFVAHGTDCDDTDAASRPDGIEVCDGADNDCDGVIDWGLAVPSDFARIQDAIDVAEDGDTVCVAAGEYVETIDLDGKSLTLQGEGAAVTTLDGDGDGPVVRMGSAEEDVTISGFTITGGHASSGAAIYMVRADATLAELTIVGNTAETPSLYGTDTGAGVVYVESSVVRLYASEIRGNTASAENVRGGALTISSSYSELLDVRISDNDAAGEDIQGGAVYLYDSTVDLEDVEITGNVATSSRELDGGAVYAVASSVDWSGGRLADTRSESEDAASGTFYSVQGNLGLDRVAIVGNSLYGRFSAYGGALNAKGGDVRIQNALIAGNSVLESWNKSEGGGIYATGWATVHLDHVDLVGNSAVTGGGLYDQSAFWTVSNTNVASNEAEEGGAIYAYGASAELFGFGHSNVYGNGSDAWHGVDDPTGVDGNISADPLYTDFDLDADPEDWDLTLSEGSPSIDAGTGTDANGTAGDIGAYGGPDGSWP